MIQTGSETSRIVDKAEALYRDVGLSRVREWKDEVPGRKAVGYLPVWAPVELVRAAGMLPVAIMGGGEDVEIIRGDAFFQSYICHLPRSTIEMSLNGDLDPLDAMIFPSICDVVRNLSGMWQMLFPERPAFYLDLPQSFDDAGRDFFTHELESLLEMLSDLAGVSVTPDDLHRGIVEENEHRTWITTLYDRRRKEPWKYPTSEVYLVIRAGNVLPVEEHNQLIHEYMAAAEREDRRPQDNIRVVISGSFCEQPPLNLIRTIEQAGCYIVDDDLVLGNRLIKGPVAQEGAPLVAIATALLEDSREAAFLYREAEKGRELVEKVQAAGAEGVLFCAPSFCDPALLDQPMLSTALDRAEIPFTSFKYTENTGQFHSIREQAGTFADSIKLWA